MIPITACVLVCLYGKKKEKNCIAWEEFEEEKKWIAWKKIGADNRVQGSVQIKENNQRTGCVCLYGEKKEKRNENALPGRI